MSNSISGNAGGSIAANASIRLLSKNVSAPDSELYAGCDASGNFVFTGVAPGIYTLLAFLDGYVYRKADDVVVVSSDLTDINLTPTPITAS